MKRTVLSFVLLISMLLGLAASAAAAPTPEPAATQQSEPAQSVVARVYFTTQDELDSLAARYDIAQVDHEKGFALIILSAREYAALEQAGYRLEVDESKTALINQPRESLPGQVNGIPGYPCYRTVEETYATLEEINTAHPDMAELIDIGDSWDKTMPGGNPGYDIRALRLSNENFGVMDEKPTFFLMAEIHAREYTTAETATRYAEYLINNYNVDPDVTWLLNYYRVYIVTMTNPDGRKHAETGEMWRKNVDNDDGCTYADSWGVDLNRNHSFHWVGGGSSTYPCDETYRGPSAASEPETQAIQNFVATLFPDQRGPGDGDVAPADTTGSFITLHSFARVVLYPWGWTSTPSPNSTQLATLGRKFGYFNGYEVCQSDSPCMYLTNGTSDDWAYGNLGIAGYTFEIGTGFFESCGSFESITYPENLPALLYALKAARHPYLDPKGPDSLNVSAAATPVEPGTQILLTATADDTRYNSGGHGTEPTQNISEARYSIDSPSWISGTVTIPMQPSDGAFNSKVEAIEAPIDTTGMSVGRHIIYVESKDVDGNWGVPSAAFLFLIEPGVSPVIDGYVRDGSTNLPVAATVDAGLFNATTNPATGYYSMTVISGTYDLVVQADNLAPAYAKGVVAQDYQTVSWDFLLYPYCDIFSDDVENGNQGWTAQSPWAITTLSSHSPTHSWTDSPGGNYGDDIDLSITSAALDLSDFTGVSLNFWHKYATELDYDYANVQYSTDGVDWRTVKSYTGYQNTWTAQDLTIPGLDGAETGYIRFNLTSDTYVEDDGWYVDDISLQGGGPSCVANLAPTAEFSSNSPVDLGQAVTFSNQTSGTPPIAYQWDFGDGEGTSTEANPSYTYTATGTYTVTLTATSAYGSDTVQHPVVVVPTRLTAVELTQVTPGAIVPGRLAYFSADLMPNEAAKPYSFSIDFGDGNVVSDVSSEDPLLLGHIYAQAGQYTLQISVQNEGMTQPVTDTLEVTVAYQAFLPITMK